ncbi:MAG: ISNCY family transposase [Bacteroidota bacterium]
MRNRFEPQIFLGQLLIEETPIPKKCRDSLASLAIALKTIYITPEYNEMIYNILENKILYGKKKTGRRGMNLWQIFVLAQVRLCLNISYDRLHWMANFDMCIRQLMGIESDFGYAKKAIEYQNILDNVSLLDDETIKELNEVIVAFGHDVFKKKEMEALRLKIKTDSFVVESNVHFPSDYNLLWDCARKCLDTVSAILKKHTETSGWRKLHDWHGELKSLVRSLGKSTVSGGKDKEIRVKQAAKSYLTKANALAVKIEKGKKDFPLVDSGDLALHITLDKFFELLNKHIDLVNRRIILGETIPHQEKMFSVFEEYTEWITKGKQHPNVELGKNLAITTDQYGLIVDYHIMEKETDNQIVLDLAIRMLNKYKVESWSFDKGFYCKENKELLMEQITKVIMPKKGKCNKSEREEETTRSFTKLRKTHSAVESNINELEHRGLDRCPDRSYPHFKRYIGLGISAYNLRRIGHKLLEELGYIQARKAA